MIHLKSLKHQKDINLTLQYIILKNYTLRPMRKGMTCMVEVSPYDSIWLVSNMSVRETFCRCRC